MVVDVPDTGQQLLFADGQPLLLATDLHERAHGGHGDVLQAVVQEECVIQIIGGGEMELSYDACSQSVIPWQQVAAGESSRLRKDIAVLRTVDDELIDLQRQVAALPEEVKRTAAISDACDENTRQFEGRASVFQEAAKYAQSTAEKAQQEWKKKERQQEADIEEVKDSMISKQSNKGMVLVAVEANGYELGNASEVLREDREVVMAAVVQNGCALKYASAALRADKEVVLEALAEDGRALKYASAALRADGEAVRRRWHRTEACKSMQRQSRGLRSAQRPLKRLRLKPQKPQKRFVKRKQMRQQHGRQL